MITKADVKGALLTVLPLEIDPALRRFGFTRQLTSLEYSRQCTQGLQAIDFYFEFRPKSDPAAVARVYPLVKIVLPQLNQLVQQMTAGASMLVADSFVTMSYPIDIVIPKERHERWYVFNVNSVGEVVHRMQSTMMEYIIPFLEEYQTCDAIVRGYEKHDERLLWERSFYIYVAAAYLQLGYPEMGMRMMERHFHRPGARREYKPVFDFLLRAMQNQ